MGLPALAEEGKVRVELDASEAPHLQAWGEEARELILKWRPRIHNLLPTKGTPAPQQIKLCIRKSDKGLASTSGSVITISSHWIDKHPEDIGVVLHELVHVVQAYPNGSPWWVTEGIADYLRWGIYQGQPLESFPRPRIKKGYEKGYQVAAGFLLWLESDRSPGIVNKLNTAMRKGKYSEEIFRAQTGQSLDELWDAYVK